MTAAQRVRAAVLTCLMLSTPAWASEVSDLMLKAAVDRAVVLQVDGGLELHGTLLGFDAEFITVMRSDGQITALERGRVDGLTLPQPAVPSQPTVAPQPPAAGVRPSTPYPAPTAPAPIDAYEALGMSWRGNVLRLTLQQAQFPEETTQRAVDLARDYRRGRSVNMGTIVSGLVSTVIGLGIAGGGIALAASSDREFHSTGYTLLGVGGGLTATGLVVAIPDWGKVRKTRAAFYRTIDEGNAQRGGAAAL